MNSDGFDIGVLTPVILCLIHVLEYGTTPVKVLVAAKSKRFFFFLFLMQLGRATVIIVTTLHYRTFAQVCV